MQNFGHVAHLSLREKSVGDVLGIFLRLVDIEIMNKHLFLCKNFSWIVIFW